MSEKQTIKDFIKRWTNRGAEKQDTHAFWLDLLKSVFNVTNPSELIEFEKSVELDHKSFIDAYIPLTRVLIEQKSKNIPLDKRISQSDNQKLTPYQQAKRYSDCLPVSQHAKWIVTCNFQEFWIYNMEIPKVEPEVVQLKNLDEEWPKLKFLIETGEDKSIKEGDTGFILDEAFYTKLVKLHFREHRPFVWVSIVTGHRSPPPHDMLIEVRLDELFKHISLRLTGRCSLRGFIDAISSYKKGYYVDSQDALSVKNKYDQLGLIRDISNGKTSLIELTALGRKIMNELNPI